MIFGSIAINIFIRLIVHLTDISYVNIINQSIQIKTSKSPKPKKVNFVQ